MKRGLSLATYLLPSPPRRYLAYNTITCLRGAPNLPKYAAPALLSYLYHLMTSLFMNILISHDELRGAHRNGAAYRHAARRTGPCMQRRACWCGHATTFHSVACSSSSAARANKRVRAAWRFVAALDVAPTAQLARDGKAFYSLTLPPASSHFNRRPATFSFVATSLSLPYYSRFLSPSLPDSPRADGSVLFCLSAAFCLQAYAGVYAAGRGHLLHHLPACTYYLALSTLCCTKFSTLDGFRFCIQNEMQQTTR